MSISVAHSAHLNANYAAAYSSPGFTAGILSNVVHVANFKAFQHRMVLAYLDCIKQAYRVYFFDHLRLDRRNVRRLFRRRHQFAVIFYRSNFFLLYCRLHNSVKVLKISARHVMPESGCRLVPKRLGRWVEHITGRFLLQGRSAMDWQPNSDITCLVKVFEHFHGIMQTAVKNLLEKGEG
ncbi:hypothetical protein C8R43DRAFT_322331 [Mycena crocata]|nr:hypothetical protein C8R43DRAFT_322331 [Mycena crocata]